MGDRNLIVVKKSGEIKIAQFCKWGAYPYENGIEVLDFLKEDNNMANLEKSLGNVIFSTDEVEYADVDVLSIVANSRGKVFLKNSIEFADDELNCEFIYMIDFDHYKFNIFKNGFSELIESFSLNDLPDNSKLYR